MPIAVWNSQLETGHPMVDHQHMTLFQMVNDLDLAIGSGSGSGQVHIEPILKRLVTYTLEHFKAEEVMMASRNYPDIHRHKAAHDALVTKVNDLVIRFDNGETVLPSELSRFLTDWLNHHIKQEDKLMIDWLNLMP